LKIVNWILLAILSFFTILLATNTAQARVVLTDSMSPKIKPGDVVISVSTKIKTPKIGDVVTYTGKKFDGTPVALFTHRVIGGDLTTGLVVKGDRNQNTFFSTLCSNRNQSHRIALSCAWFDPFKRDAKQI
jgi:signal peptidase I